ncbi:hypothetical protein Pcinc_037238 [Petrolisthes cinctipes]|uniref:Uncharacterized protein n=1 Tax=Petrolisthes cinctipes TaxID=88211 RepID=A0AAE1BW31_PETCI|nr:hypothetical protein Pcinc_037238 [Petrolisthes cinctipes]
MVGIRLGDTGTFCIILLLRDDMEVKRLVLTAGYVIIAITPQVLLCNVPPLLLAKAAKQPVNQANPPAKQPVNQANPPAKQPVNQANLPAKQPVNQANLPAKQPVNQANLPAMDLRKMIYTCVFLLRLLGGFPYTQSGEKFAFTGQVCPRAKQEKRKEEKEKKEEENQEDERERVVDMGNVARSEKRNSMRTKSGLQTSHTKDRSPHRLFSPPSCTPSSSPHTRRQGLSFPSPPLYFSTSHRRPEVAVSSSIPYSRYKYSLGWNIWSYTVILGLCVFAWLSIVNIMSLPSVYHEDSFTSLIAFTSADITLGVTCVVSVLHIFVKSSVVVKLVTGLSRFNTQIQLRGCDIRFALGIIVKLTIQVFALYSTSYWWHILNTSTLAYIKEVTSLILYICVDNFVLNFFYVNVRLQTALYENLKASVHSMYSLDQPRRGESGSTEPENDRYNIPDVNTKAPGHFSVSTTTYEYPEALTGLQKIWHVQPFVDETVVSSVYNDSTSVTPVINFSNDLHTTCKPVAPVNPIPEDIYVAHKPAPQVIDRSEDVFSCTMGARNTIETSIRKKKQLRATRHEILHLQDLHRLCVSYLGLLLILDLCMCLVLLILTAFSLSQFWETDLTLFVYMMVMCVEMTLTFLILLNIPTVMQTEVDELRLVLRSLLHRVEEDREVKEEVSFSISVVVIDPLRHSKCT